MSDHEEELVNYSQLLKKSKTAKADQDQTTQAQSALFQCLENKGRLQKSICEGLVDSGGIRVTVSKGTHLHTMGFSHLGQSRLHVEEAAFLVSRNALIVRKEGRVLQFSDLLEMVVDDVWLTLDKYLVYAYLKRLGYIVMRAKKNAIQSIPPKKAFETHDQSQPSVRPLIWNYACSDYAAVFSRLRIIPHVSPALPLYQHWMLDWEVYKPRPSWKKKEPGLPDFNITVANVKDPVPTLHTRYQMLAQTKETKLLTALVGNTEGVLFYHVLGNTVQPQM